MPKKVEFVLDLKTDGIKSKSGQAKKAVEGIDDATKKTTQSTDRMTKAWSKFQRIIAAAAVFEIMRRGMRQMITMGKEFEQSLADLEAITGITGDALDSLGKDAIETSNQYGVAASRVVEAQKLVASQLAEKIDFGTEAGVRELSEIADAATLLSKAAGTELEPAVSTVTTALNQFNLPASEANRIVNAIAAGSKLGAAELEAQGEAIKDSGTSAAAANISFEQLNASIQTLAANGVKGSQAGVGLRNIFVRLETQSEKLAAAGYEVNLQQDGLIATLEKLRPLTEDVSLRTEVFGERAQGLAQILINNVDSLENLEGAITGTNTAQEQADIQMNTFEGSVERLSAAFNNKLITAFMATNGVIVKMINSLTWLVEEFAGGLSVINGWIEGNQELRREMALQEHQLRSTIDAVQDNIKAAKEAIDAGGLDAKQRQELTEFIEEQETALRGLGETYKGNIEQMNDRRDAMKAELNQLKENNSGSVEHLAAIKQLEVDLKKLDVQIESNAKRYEIYTEKINAATKAAQENNDTTDEQVESKKNLAAQLEANEKAIQKLLTSSGALSMAQIDEIASLMAQNESIEQQIELREKLARSRMSGDELEDDFEMPELDIDDLKFDWDFEPLITAGEIFEDLENRVSSFVNMSDLLGDKQHDISFAIGETVSAIERLVDAGYDPTSDAVNDLVDQYDKLMRAQQAQNTFMQVMVSSQISSLRDLGNVVAQETARAIKARIAEAVATQVGKVLSTVPFPFNVAAAAAAAGAVSLLFDKVIPEFQDGGIVTGGGMPSGMTTAGKKLISINEDARPEFIVNADSTAAALPLLEAINDDASFARNIVGGFQGGGSVNKENTNTDAIAAAVERGMRNARVTARVDFSEFDDEYNDFQQFQKRIGNTE